MQTKRKGLCINFDGCKYADNKMPIEVDISADFECPECHRDLVEFDKRRYWKKYYKYVIIMISLIVVGLAAYLSIIKISRDASSTIIATGIDIVSNSDGDLRKKTNTLENTQPDKSSIETTKKSFQGNDHPNGLVSSAVPTNNSNQILKDVERNDFAKNTWETLEFPNGDRYVGETKMGLLHGAGTYYFSSRQIISNMDLKERYAEAGYILKGNWHEGHFSHGKLYDKNEKYIDTIIIGQ